MVFAVSVVRLRVVNQHPDDLEVGMNLANFVNEGQLSVQSGDGVVNVAKIANHIVGLVRVVAEEHLDP